jgi:hypothetical protein
MLPLDELARLQADITALLGDTCDIYDNNSTPDGFGGIVSGWAVSAADVACRLDQKSGREQVSSGGMRWFTTNTLSLPANTAITTESRVLHNDVWYTVTNIKEGSHLGVTRATLERMAQ